MIAGYFIVAVITTTLIAFIAAWPSRNYGRFNFDNGVKAAGGMSMFFAVFGGVLYFMGVL